MNGELYHYYKFAFKTLESNFFYVSKLTIMYKPTSQKHVILKVLAIVTSFLLSNYCVSGLLFTPSHNIHSHSHFHMNIFHGMYCFLAFTKV